MPLTLIPVADLNLYNKYRKKCAIDESMVNLSSVWWWKYIIFYFSGSDHHPFQVFDLALQLVAAIRLDVFATEFEWRSRVAHTRFSHFHIVFFPSSHVALCLHFANVKYEIEKGKPKEERKVIVWFFFSFCLNNFSVFSSALAENDLHI